VALAAIAQSSPIVWIVRADSDIHTPQDLAGHRLMIMPPPESAELLAMLLAEGVDLDELELIPTSFDIQDLIEGNVDAYDGYSSNEPYWLSRNGQGYRLIKPRTYGVDFYNDVLITRQALLDDRPDDIAAFRSASLRGWEFALNNIEETAELIQDRYAPQKTLDHLISEGRKLRELVKPELVQVGHMNPGRWETICETYRELGMSSGTMDLNRFLYTQPREEGPGFPVRLFGVAILVLTIISLVAFQLARLNIRLRREAHKREQVEEALLQKQDELYQLANTDALTGLWNRQKFEAVCEMEIRRARRYKHPLSLIFCDLDHFKFINDEYGHHTGDQALKACADLFKSQLRASDYVCRWGGEEFLVVVPHATGEETLALAEKLRRTAFDTDIFPGKRITLSLGVAELKDNEPLTGLVQRADQALYQAKQSGRNRVVLAD